MIRVNGVQLDYDSKAIARMVKQASGKQLMQAGAIVERAAKESMRAGGREEGPRGGKRRIPSDPGKPPHVQTGTLRGSVTHAMTETGSVIVGPTRIAWYAAIHEKGGEFGGRDFPARPFMVPALVSSTAQIKGTLKDMKLSSTPEGQRLNAKRGKRP